MVKIYTILSKQPICACECYTSFWQITSQKLDTADVFECARLTDQGVCDVGPVDTVLQLQLVMWLDVEQQVLIETHARDQVCTVGTLQCAAAVDVLRCKEKEKKNDAFYPFSNDAV